jgi:hypothetical protein
MTSRIDALVQATITGSKISVSEASRAEAEAAHHAANRRRAALVAAACSRDAEEFRMLAGMLGLDRADYEAARVEMVKRSRRHKAA